MTATDTIAAPSAKPSTTSTSTGLDPETAWKLAWDRLDTLYKAIKAAQAGYGREDLMVKFGLSEEDARDLVFGSKG
jgi:hypothetical protein